MGGGAGAEQITPITILLDPTVLSATGMEESLGIQIILISSRKRIRTRNHRQSRLCINALDVTPRGIFAVVVLIRFPNDLFHGFVPMSADGSYRGRRGILGVGSVSV